jgi:hypothetical protein
MVIDIFREILDQQFAADFPAEERDIRADHRSEVEQDRLLAAVKPGQEASQRLRRLDQLVSTACLGDVVVPPQSRE